MINDILKLLCTKVLKTPFMESGMRLGQS
jgi:hypothetical protein